MSVAGITGERDALPAELLDQLRVAADAYPCASASA